MLKGIRKTTSGLSTTFICRAASTSHVSRGVNHWSQHKSKVWSRSSHSLPLTIQQTLDNAEKNIKNASPQSQGGTNQPTQIIQEDQITQIKQLTPTATSEGNITVIQGWIKSIRRQKRVAFAHISDGTDLDSHGIQVVFEDPSMANDKRLCIGCSVRIVGDIVKSSGRGQKFELVAKSITVLGESDLKVYPIQKKEHTVDYLREHAHLRPRTDEIAKMLRLRHAARRAFESYFDNNNFINIDTPILTMNDCEGGGEVFQVSHEHAGPSPTSPVTASNQPSSESRPQETDNKESTGSNRSGKSTTVESKEGAQSNPSHFFGSPAYLTVSSQLHLEVFTSSFSRVYTLQPAFRAERSHTSRHLSEFWMLEAEMSFLSDLDHVMDVVEASIKYVCGDAVFRDCLALPSPPLSPLSPSPNPIPTAAQDLTQTSLPSPSKGQLDASKQTQTSFLDNLISQSWKRITYTQALDAINGVFGPGTIEWGQPISTEQERWIADEVGMGLPVFVTGYPADIKPFYMRMIESGSSDESKEFPKHGNGTVSWTARKTVACFDLLVPRIGELAGGSLREERLDNLIAAYGKHGLDPAQYAWYTDLRRFGTTPHGGFGLGFERFISWIGGWENVRECIATPRWKGRCIL